MSSNRGSYTTPAAFRRALTGRLKELTKTSRWSLTQLQRQMAYDRLLERTFCSLLVGYDTIANRAVPRRDVWGKLQPRRTQLKMVGLGSSLKAIHALSYPFEGRASTGEPLQGRVG